MASDIRSPFTLSVLYNIVLTSSPIVADFPIPIYGTCSFADCPITLSIVLFAVAPTPAAPAENLVLSCCWNSPVNSFNPSKSSCSCANSISSYALDFNFCVSIDFIILGYCSTVSNNSLYKRILLFSKDFLVLPLGSINSSFCVSLLYSTLGISINNLSISKSLPVFAVISSYTTTVSPASLGKIPAISNASVDAKDWFGIR